MDSFNSLIRLLYFCLFFYGVSMTIVASSDGILVCSVFMLDHCPLEFLLPSYACMPSEEDGLQNRSYLSNFTIREKCTHSLKSLCTIIFHFIFFPDLYSIHYISNFHPLDQCLN